MRKIINFTHATLDGYIDDPQDWWCIRRRRPAGLRAPDALAADALLLGRVTFEGMAQAWPAMGDHPFAGPFVERVATRSPTTSSPRNRSTPPLWDPTVVIAGTDLVDEVSRLKEDDGADILIWGTGRLTTRSPRPVSSTTGSRPARSSRETASPWRRASTDDPRL